MASHNEPYDPYIPNSGAGNNASSSQPSNNRTAALQAVGLPSLDLKLCATNAIVDLWIGIERTDRRRACPFETSDACLCWRILADFGNRSLHHHFHQSNDHARPADYNWALNWHDWQEIDSTVGIMRENINKVSDRGERLDALQDKTDNLERSAQGFRRGANRVRKAMW